MRQTAYRACDKRNTNPKSIRGLRRLMVCLRHVFHEGPNICWVALKLVRKQLGNNLQSESCAVMKRVLPWLRQKTRRNVLHCCCCHECKKTSKLFAARFTTEAVSRHAALNIYDQSLVGSCCCNVPQLRGRNQAPTSHAGVYLFWVHASHVMRSIVPS